jgi:hypothetical protein
VFISRFKSLFLTIVGAGAAPRGAVLPFIALTLAAVLGFAGLAVDVAYLEYCQDQQQTAADAAAVAGAQQLALSPCPSASAAACAAWNDSAANGFANSGSVTVTVQNPPVSGPFASNNCAVLVQVTKTNVSTFFSRLFGFSNGATETTQAVAVPLTNDNGCIFMLASGQNTNFNGSNVTAPNCSILLNGSANFNGSTVDAAAIGEVNYSGSNNSGTFTGATPAPMLHAADPCLHIAGCAYLTSNPPSTSPCSGTYSGSGVLGPGCYDNLNLNKATVTFSGGLYIFAGSSNMNKAAITASGSTIYIPSGASTNFNNVSALTLSPPTTGNYAGVSYYQVSANTGNVNFNGSSTNISGLLYAPAAQINYNGSFGQYTVVVAAYANFNGSTGEDFGSPPPDQSLIRKAVLAQ